MIKLDLNFREVITKLLKEETTVELVVAGFNEKEWSNTMQKDILEVLERGVHPDEVILNIPATVDENGNFQIARKTSISFNKKIPADYNLPHYPGLIFMWCARYKDINYYTHKETVKVVPGEVIRLKT